MKRRLSAVGALAAVAGLACAACVTGGVARTVANGESGPLPPDTAQVCVVRPEALAGEISLPVRDNGRLVGATRGRTYFCYLAANGFHQITSDDDTGPQLLRAEAGRRYWLHQDIVELAGELHAHLDWIDEHAALEMVDACERRVHVAVPGHDESPAALPIAPATRM